MTITKCSPKNINFKSNIQLQKNQQLSTKARKLFKIFIFNFEEIKQITNSSLNHMLDQITDLHYLPIVYFFVKLQNELPLFLPTNIQLATPG